MSGLVALACLLLAGCGGGGAQPTVTPVPTATIAPPTPTATPVPPAMVGEIAWATSVIAVTNAPSGEVSRFAPETRTLYAVVRVENLRPGSVLSAAWTYNGTALDGAASAVVPPQAFPGGFVQFHLTRDEGSVWPEGTYAIALSLDGKEVQRSSIEVAAA